MSYFKPCARIALFRLKKRNASFLLAILSMPGLSRDECGWIFSDESEYLCCYKSWVKFHYNRGAVSICTHFKSSGVNNFIRRFDSSRPWALPRPDNLAHFSYSQNPIFNQQSLRTFDTMRPI